MKGHTHTHHTRLMVYPITCIIHISHECVQSNATCEQVNDVFRIPEKGTCYYTKYIAVLCARPFIANKSCASPLKLLRTAGCHSESLRHPAHYVRTGFLFLIFACADINVNVCHRGRLKIVSVGIYLDSINASGAHNI